MRWETVERASLTTSAGLLVGCSVIGFRWVRSPYLAGYAALAAGLYVLSRLAGSLR